MELHKVVDQLDVDDANLSGSRFHNVNLSSSSVSDANLSRMTVTEAAAYEAAMEKQEA